MNENNGKLSNLIRTSFMIPNIGLNLFIYLELYYMSYFLTDICGFKLSVVTFILTSTAAVDLIWVFVTGIILEKSNFKTLGKYRAWYVIASPVIIVFFSIMFLDMSNSIFAAAIVIVCFCIKTLFQDIISAALTGQLSQMTDNVEERALLSARRNQGRIIGQLIFSLIGVPVIAFSGKLFDNVALGYTIAAIVFTVINAICHWILFAATKNAPIAVSETVGESAKLSVGTMFKVFFKNPPLLIISFGDLLRYTAYFLVSSTAAYYFAAVLKNSGAISIYLTVQTAVGLVAAIVVNTIMKKIGKKATYVIGTLVYGAALIVAYFVGGEKTTVLFIIIMAVGFFFNSLITTVITAMTSDTVIYTMWKDGINARGFIMSMLNIPIKFGSMIKSLILPLGLAAIGYVAGAETTPEVAKGIATIMCLVSGICVLLSCVIILTGYKLSEKRVDEMTEEIQRRQS